MIKIYNETEFLKMKIAGSVAAKLLDEIESYIKPGITTSYLNTIAKNFMDKENVISAPFGYKNKIGKAFPGYICTSLNHVICHGIPDETILKEGDIIKVDVTIIKDGFFADTCKTYPVGKISKEDENLINATKQALEIGIESIKFENAKANFQNIGKAIESFIKKETKYSIVEDYCGHGVGTAFHMPPQILHYYDPEFNEEIKPGMIFTIEPMINQGKKHTRLLSDSWTVVTKDYSKSAQFEHSIGILENEIIVFTK